MLPVHTQWCDRKTGKKNGWKSWPHDLTPLHHLRALHNWCDIQWYMTISWGEKLKTLNFTVSLLSSSEQTVTSRTLKYIGSILLWTFSYDRFWSSFNITQYPSCIHFAYHPLPKVKYIIKRYDFSNQDE